MKLKLILLSLVTAFSSSGWADEATTARLTVPRTFTLNKIVIDGDLRDRAWEQGTMTYGFVHADGTGSPKTGTRARLIYDYHALYIGFTVAESDLDSLKGATSGSDMENADAVGLLLEYPDASGELRTLQVWIDHLNSVALSDEKAAGESGIKTAVNKRPGAWDVEVVIPWSALGAVAPSFGDLWRVNFFRSQSSPQNASDTSSQWLPDDVMGELRFGRDCLVYVYSKRSFYSPDEVMVFNYSDRLRRFSITYVNEVGEEIQAMPVHLGPGHRRQHYKMEGLEHGVYTVIVRDRDARPGEDDVIMVVPRPQFGR